jgi:hypothetical protein
MVREGTRVCVKTAEFVVLAETVLITDGEASYEIETIDDADALKDTDSVIADENDGVIVIIDVTFEIRERDGVDDVDLVRRVDTVPDVLTVLVREDVVERVSVGELDALFV